MQRIVAQNSSLTANAQELIRAVIPVRVLTMKAPTTWLRDGSREKQHIRPTRSTQIASPKPLQNFGPLRGHSEVIRDLAFSPEGRLPATANMDKTVRIWDVSKFLPPAESTLYSEADRTPTMQTKCDLRIATAFHRTGLARTSASVPSFS